MFKVTRGKGFQITFPNGWTASVQWGIGNYCDHHMEPFDTEREKVLAAQGSTTAEVAAISPEGKLVDLLGRGDTVAGWLSPAEVLAFLTMVAGREA
jgi:hypothetical protein